MPHTRTDTLPRLPIVSRAAEDGCQYCVLLLNALRSRSYNCPLPTDVTITFEYVWATDQEYPPGLKFLVANLWLHEDDDIFEEPRSLVFNIGMDLGKQSP